MKFYAETIDEKGGVIFIMDQLVNGKSYKRIADDLNVKSKFIKDYMKWQKKIKLKKKHH